jgi:methanogenic corrinoid protein MtbC1
MGDDTLAIVSETDLLTRRTEVASAARTRLGADWVDCVDDERLRMVFDLEMHLAFLAAALRCDSAALFDEYANWTHHLLVSTGREDRPFLACLDAIDATLQEWGRGDWVDRARALLASARGAMATETAVIETYLTPDNPHGALAREFLDACLQLRRADALAMVHRAVDDGTTVREIYLDVITPVLRELGRLWHRNRVSVGQEHYCTAVAQMVMAELFPGIFDGDRRSGRLVSTCITGELHEIGARMLTDLFEMHGWDTVFLGADVPNSSVIDTLIEQDADILAISATLGANLGEVADLILSVRSTPRCAGIRIMVGGAAFNVDNTIWQTLGADGWAPDPQAAIALAANWGA